MSEEREQPTGDSHETGMEAMPQTQEREQGTPSATEDRAREGASLGVGSLIDVPLRVTVEIGAARMLVREVLQLNKGSVVALDRMSGDPADILVNGRVIARGEVTMLDDALAVRVVELVGPKTEGRIGRPSVETR